MADFFKMETGAFGLLSPAAQPLAEKDCKSDLAIATIQRPVQEAKPAKVLFKRSSSAMSKLHVQPKVSFLFYFKFILTFFSNLAKI